jgi:hypothetical protein
VRQWKEKDGRAQIAARTLGDKAGQNNERVEQHVRRPKGIVVGGEDPVEAALVCTTGHPKRQIERLRTAHLAGIERSDVDAELHVARRVALSDFRRSRVMTPRRLSPVVSALYSNVRRLAGLP